MTRTAARTVLVLTVSERQRVNNASNSGVVLRNLLAVMARDRSPAFFALQHSYHFGSPCFATDEVEFEELLGIESLD